MRLNPDNDLVKAIYGFVGPKLEAVRRKLVEQQREQRASEEAKRLRKEASQIEEIINHDFDAFRRRLQKVKAAAAKTGFDAGDGSAGGGDGTGPDDFLAGGDAPAAIVSETGEIGKHGEGEGVEDGPPRRLNPVVQPDEKGEAKGHYETADNGKPRRRGGFTIEFDNQGAESARATYQAEKRTIFVNLDHPQIATALQGRSPEDAVFKRLAYEVAFSEYAVALAQELDNHGEYADISDPIVDIRVTLNRVALAAASLYS